MNKERMIENEYEYTKFNERGTKSAKENGKGSRRTC